MSAEFIKVTKVLARFILKRCAEAYVKIMKITCMRRDALNSRLFTARDFSPGDPRTITSM